MGDASSFPPPVVVVTGASRGLGAGLAEAFADAGLQLGLCARHRPPVPESANVADVVTAAVDVTDADAVGAFVDEVVERLGRIDVWVNNAGVLDPIGTLADADPRLLRRHIDVNVTGVLFGSRAFARHVRGRAGGGTLLNVSSGASSSPYEGWAAYCGSKAAVEMITQVVALEERHHGLRAYAVAPGVVDTGMQALIRSTPDASFPAVERFRRLSEEQAFNSPEWVARFMLDLVVGRIAPASVSVRVPDQPRINWPRRV